MLQGREMVLPSMQSLRAKLSPEIRGTDHEPRLENLKSKLRTAYKLAQDHSRKSHTANKRYYDRGSKKREFAVGDFVYLYNPAIKVGVSAKFRSPWVGPWRITEKRSRLNYVITDQCGKQMVVHVNRLKRAYDPVIWTEIKREKVPRELRPKRRQPEEEEEIFSPGPIPIRAPPVENERQSSVRLRQVLDTPTPGPSPREAPSNHRVDPTYAPSDTPRSRRDGSDARKPYPNQASLQDARVAGGA
jgi:hypothetical protein